ncbi:MAG: hypothetical protein HQM08_09595 [Candidatus Riflebacteria bacterium]|nr:hypothetical protein [Candidatus Riflebacteria bacterium]
MKRIFIVSVFFVMCVLLSSPVFAVNKFVYPDQKNPMFEITFPDTWKTDFDDKGVLHAYPENWEVYWIMTVAEGGDKGNTKTEEAMTKQINEWIKDYKYEEKAKEFKINDIDFWVWDGTGIDNYKDSKTFGKPVSVEYCEFEPKEGTVGHIVSFEDPANTKKYSEDMKSIMESIKIIKK